MKDLDKIILRAIPVNYSCALNEHRNKVAREWLKKEFKAYLDEQLANQFNAKPVLTETIPGVSAGAN